MFTEDELSTAETRLAAFSEAYDLHGPGDDLARAGNELKLSAQQQQSLISEWQSIAAGLNEVAATSANLADGVLVDTVLAEIRQKESVPNIPSVETSGSVRGRGQRLARIIALATTSVAMLYVSLHIATHEKSLNRSAEVLASFSFDPQGWDVVVVTVSDEQAAQLSRDLAADSSASGLQMTPLLANQKTAGKAYEVVMTSKETSKKLLGTLGSDAQMSAAEWNPKMVGEWDRDELLERFANSMKTPTRSDLFFAEAIVVTSDEDRGIRVTSRATDSSSNTDTLAHSSDAASLRAGSNGAGSNGAGSKGATSQADQRLADGKITLESESVLRQLQDHGRRPVLVVFQRRSDDTTDGEGNAQDPTSELFFYL